MRSTLLAAALLLACVRPHPSTAAPSRWQWESPRPQGSPIVALVAAGASIHAVGLHGAAVRSRDGGATWTVATTGTTADLTAIAAGPRAIIAVGGGGTILRSTDGGATFAPRPSPIADGLAGVAFAPGGRVYVLAGGGALLRSDDGGDTFAVQPGRAPSDPFASPLLAPADDVVLVGGSTGLVRSTDGGATFAPVAGVGGPIARLLADGRGTIYAIGAADVVYGTVAICNSCIDAGYPTLTLFRSADGGATWEQRELVDPDPAIVARGWHAPAAIVPPATPPAGTQMGGYGSYHPPFVRARWLPLAAAVGPAGELYVDDDRAGLLASTDRGATFATLPAARHGALAATTAGDLVGASGAVLRRSIDRGATWTETSSALGDRDNLFDLTVTDGGDAIAVGMSGLLAVRDPATSRWRALATGLGDLRLVAIHADGATVVAVGDGGTILRSTDGGRTFAPRTSGTDVGLRAVWGTRGTWLVAGDDGVLLRSRDGGDAWRALPSLVTDAGISLWGSSPADVYLVTINGQRLHSVDGGRRWLDVGAGTTGVLTQVWGTGPRDVYLVGWEGRIFHSIDRGRTWQARASGTTTDLGAIWGAGPDELYVAGGRPGGSVGGVLLRSVDRGRTWHVESTPTNAPYFTIGGGAGALYVVGEGAQILRRPRP